MSVINSTGQALFNTFFEPTSNPEVSYYVTGGVLLVFSLAQYYNLRKRDVSGIDPLLCTPRLELMYVWYYLRSLSRLWVHQEDCLLTMALFNT